VTDVVQTLGAALAGRYRVERELGRGGMATVYLAEDVRHRRKVAMKVLHAELSAVIGHERFLKEIQVTAALQHPNILPLFDSGNADGQLFYVMPFVEGESLRERTKRGALSATDGIAILRDVAKALGAAHSRGVVHRDIKPENVLLSGDTAVVADFGIAKAIDASRTQPGVELTETGVSLGTPAYMSPEQALGDPVDARSDIYAWGVIAYETLSGAHPFVGKTTAQQIIAAQIAEQPAPLPARAGVTPAMTDLVARCLAKSPAERPDSAVDVIRSLDAAMMSPTTADATASGGRRWILAIAVIALATTFGAVFLTRRLPPVVTPQSSGIAVGPSLVVLPFANIGGLAENEIFADGVTEDVITHLATIGGLTVISRTSAMTYKGTTKPLKQIANELGVGAVLEGSVRRVGSRVRVVAQLIDAKTDAHRWAGTFDRELADVFAIQSEIATTIADTLKATLSPESRQRLAVRPTNDTLAYQLYVQGRAAIRERTQQSMDRGIELFQQAIQRDSNFALAYQSLANTYALTPLQGTVPARPALAKGRAAVDRALSLDPNLPEAHGTLGYILMFSDNNWSESEREFKRALAGAPSDFNVRGQYASFLSIVGRIDESVRESRVALSLDPQSPSALQSTAALLMAARQFDEALVMVRRSIALEPKNQIAWNIRWFSAWYSNRVDEAFDALVGLQDAAGIRAVTRVELGDAYSRGGKAEALRLLLAKWPVAYRPVFRTVWYAELGDREHALEWLERGYAERWISLPYVLRWPSFDGMKSDPGFVGFMRKMGLDPNISPTTR
jgi:serine/threonine-protein kinase